MNPFVWVPEEILQALFEKAGKNKGPIPVRGTINRKPYRQTLVKYQGHWRLYINTSMLKNSPQRITELIQVTVLYDAADRSIQAPPLFIKALQKNKPAKKAFDSLPPSRQKEIIRYLARLKTEEARKRNIEKAIGFLSGRNRFAGRDTP